MLTAVPPAATRDVESFHARRTTPSRPLGRRSASHDARRERRSLAGCRLALAAIRGFVFLFAVAVPISALGQTSVGGPISSDTTWEPAGNPYILSGLVNIVSSATLTIAPGTVIKAQINSGFRIRTNGSLVADGTAALPIIFTSFADDGADGQDSNNDGASTGTAGDWYGLRFEQ